MEQNASVTQRPDPSGSNSNVASLPASTSVSTSKTDVTADHNLPASGSSTIDRKNKIWGKFGNSLFPKLALVLLINMKSKTGKVILMKNLTPTVSSKNQDRKLQIQEVCTHGLS